MARIPRKPFRDCALFAGAFVLLCAIRVTLTILPFRTVRSLVDRLKTPPPLWPLSVLESKSVWAVRAAGRFVPHATCLTQSLALEVVLALQGIEAQTRFGVAKSPEGGLKGHAWVESRGKAILGSTPGEPFVPLTS